MDEEWNNMKNKLKEVLKKGSKKVIIAVLIVITVVFLLAGAMYFLTIDDGTYKEGDWSSTNYGAKVYTDGVSVNSDGTLSCDITAQELWDKLIENGSRVDQYLDSPEELARLMRAQIVTQYPDTRTNPDEEINWDEMGEDDLQGIIKFKRTDEDENTTTMVYVDPVTFQGYIDEYNSSGSETAKKNALTHFTLKKSSTSPSISINYNGPDLCWPVDGTRITSYFGPRTAPIAGASTNHGAIDIAASVGDNVYACETGTVTFAGTYGNGGNTVIIDHGNGYKSLYMHNSEFKVSEGDVVSKGQVIALAGATGNVTGPHCHFQIEYNGEKIDPLTFKYNNGMGEGTGGFGTSESIDEENDESQTSTRQRETEMEVNGDGYSQEYTSSAGITYKHYKQYTGSYANNAYWEGTIHSDGCGPSSIAILASGLTNLNYTPGDIAANMSYTSYETLKQEMETLGMSAEVIQSPSAETIQDNLRNGKVMLVSVNSNTIFTGGSHIMALVDINTSGQVYICNPGSSYLYGWYDISEITKGCNYIVVTEAGAAGIANSTSNDSTYVAVVATWRQVDTSITTNDPEVEATSTTQYSMTTTNVNYQELVDSYTVPFDLLWAFLVVGEEKEFTFEFADLIYGSDIQITIYDNLTVNTEIDDWNYTQRTKAAVDYDITAKFEVYTANDNAEDHVHDPYGNDSSYNTVKTVITQTNTVSAVLTRANVWVVDSKNDYTYAVSDEPEQSQEILIDDQEYPSQPNSTSDVFTCEHIEAIKQALADDVIRQYQEANPPFQDGEQGTAPETITSIDDVDFDESYYVEFFKKYINISDRFTSITSTKKYTKGVPEIKEKTDKDSEEPNFVTIFNNVEHTKNKRNIMSVPSWLFEIIETNDSTADMLDLIKYLLYKATGNDYGVTEWSFDDLFPMEEAGGTFGRISGDTVKEQVWNYLTSAGFTDEAAAAVMGNMQHESGVDPTCIQGGGAGPAAGICQWENYNRRTGRWKTLYNLASSRGKDWTDLQCQLDFLMTELEAQFRAYTGHGKHYYDNGEWCWWPTAMTAEQFKRLTDIDEATEIFCRVFERPSITHMSRRINYANEFYDLYHQ